VLDTKFEKCFCCNGSTMLRNNRYVCSTCQTVVISKRREFSYESEYPQQRSHHDPQVRENKKITISNWIQRLRFDLKGKNVFEFGFGSGAGIEYFQSLGANVYGVEIVQSNHDYLLERGLSIERFATSMSSLCVESRQIDFSFYFDSFEHILEPEEHLRELNALVKEGSRCFLVLPRADSLSRTVLQSFWPHDLPDHWIFYSRKGLISLFEKNGWSYVLDFNPTKRISLQMIIDHIFLKLSIERPKSLVHGASFNFNFGEMGVLFEKRG
jgi:SAM-dependent methyltransferase